MGKESKGKWMDFLRSKTKDYRLILKENEFVRISSQNVDKAYEITR